jgi:hypothetical protein
VAGWPEDVRDHAIRLAFGDLDASAQAGVGGANPAADNNSDLSDVLTPGIPSLADS